MSIWAGKSAAYVHMPSSSKNGTLALMMFWQRPDSSDPNCWYTLLIRTGAKGFGGMTNGACKVTIFKLFSGSAGMRQCIHLYMDII